ncbi:MAG: prepilin-type N-terminal cleavage/methylation domain-containing protein [Candidatus Omnitrophota bacterium]
MLLNIKKPKKSFTVIELLISLMIIAIISGAMMAMKGPFTHRQNVMNSALKLVNDLRLTQQFAISRKDEFNFYGLRFYNQVGTDDDGDSVPDRIGYKIVRYLPSGVAVTAADLININTNFEIVKSSEETDVPPAQYIDDTFFAAMVALDDTGGATGGDYGIDEQIIFNPEGSATSDGDILLVSGSNDEIVLEMGQYPVTIEITPLTGIVRIK